jgi:hypothetical protein
MALLLWHIMKCNNNNNIADFEPLALLLLLFLLQLEEWEQEPSSCQLAILEALKEVLGSLLRELSRATKLDM